MDQQVGPNKAVAAGLSGAVSVILVWLVGLSGHPIPPEVATAITTVLATGATWLTPHGG